ncbi:MAG: dTMP kinase, partial [Planctomycetia bacterium]|nr:dTMP kinase [Planctomycetia bacterium]
MIVFEGIDGAGKTTQVGLLVDALRRAGEDVVSSKEPTRGPWGMKIRESAVKGRLPEAEELQAFIEDRREHVRDLVGPALERGAIVVLDR